jgi:hypothetical protein
MNTTSYQMASFEQRAAELRQEAADYRLAKQYKQGKHAKAKASRNGKKVASATAVHA